MKKNNYLIDMDSLVEKYQTSSSWKKLLLSQIAFEKLMTKLSRKQRTETLRE